MDGVVIAMILLIAISSFFITLGCIGLHRFPDVYTRLHAATKTTTFGMIFFSAAVILFGFWRFFEADEVNKGAYLTLIGHTIVALILLLITNPTGAHAIARAARRSGIKPEQAVIDEFEEVEP